MGQPDYGISMELAAEAAADFPQDPHGAGPCWICDEQTADRAQHAAPQTPRPDKILHDAAALFQERNAVYGDNFEKVADVMAALFPQGVTLRGRSDFARWHNYELLVVKLCRFAQSGLTHLDSIHDAAVYAAITEHLTPEHCTPVEIPAP